MTRALVAFGANLGDPVAMFAEVRRRLAHLSGVKSVTASALYQTVPVGGPTDQPVFLNGALAVETTLEVEAFFSQMRLIEAALGRRRKESWGPRTIDLDLALFGESIHESANLAMPHLRMHFRRFVLAPAAEVAPDALHPLLNATLGELNAAAVDLSNGDQLLALVADDVDERAETVALFTHRHPLADVVALPPAVIPAAAVMHAGAIIGARLAVHLPGVEDRNLERDLDRVWVAASRRRLWVATSVGFHSGVHAAGALVVPAVDLHAADPPARRQQLLHFIESLAEPTRI